MGRDEVVRGQVVVKPGSIAPHRQGRADVVLLGKDEGGRKHPCTSGYTPRFYFGTTDVPGTLAFEAPLLEPSNRADVAFELGRPIALEPGMRFAMREGGRTIGAGVVSAVS